jgi:hypothetical protein
MRKNTLFALALTGLSMALVSSKCKKDDTPAGPGKAELMAKTWRMTAKTVQIGSGNPTDAFSVFGACEKDDLLVLRSNGTYEKNEGATKCAPTDPQIKETGGWSLIESNVKVKLSQSPTLSQTLEILEITTTSMKLKQATSSPSGNITTIDTYVAQ